MRSWLIAVGWTGSVAPKPLLSVPEFQPLLLIPSALIETDSAVISDHESLQLNVFNDIFEKILPKASVCIFKLKPAKYSVIFIANCIPYS